MPRGKQGSRNPFKSSVKIHSRVVSMSEGLFRGEAPRLVNIAWRDFVKGVVDENLFRRWALRLVGAFIR